MSASMYARLRRVISVSLVVALVALMPSSPGADAQPGATPIQWNPHQPPSITSITPVVLSGNDMQLDLTGRGRPGTYVVVSDGVGCAFGRAHQASRDMVRYYPDGAINRFRGIESEYTGIRVGQDGRWAARTDVPHRAVAQVAPRYISVNSLTPNGLRSRCRTIALEKRRVQFFGFDTRALGDIESVVRHGDHMVIKGWAASLATTSEPRIHLNLRAASLESDPADRREHIISRNILPQLRRPDVERVIPGAVVRGFAVRWPVPVDMSEVRVCGVVFGGDTLGCEEQLASAVTSPDAIIGSPSGIVGEITRLFRADDGGVRIEGWAIHTGSNAGIEVDIVTADDRSLRVAANKPLPLLSRRLPDHGIRHRFVGQVIDLPIGLQRVCIKQVTDSSYALVMGGPANDILDCKMLPR